MPNDNDPRNLFVNQRYEYNEKTQPKQQPNARQQTERQSNARQQQTNSPQSDYEAKLAEMKRLAAKYEREGEGQLVRDIVNNVIEQKARGQLSNDQLVAFANRVRPLLNNEQRARLDGLLEQLLKI